MTFHQVSLGSWSRKLEKNILTILGSPRKRGNTAAVLEQFERLAGQVARITRVNLPDYTIRGCRGCDACRRVLDEPGCIQRDDAPQILDYIRAADLVVYATPVYVWDSTSQMKALFDRHYCMVKWQLGQVVRALLAGKQTALLVTCGGPAEDNADLLQIIFEREMAYLRCQVCGMYVVDNCTTPADLGERAVQTAAQMARELPIDFHLEEQT